MAHRTILLTGSAGRVAELLIPALATSYDLRLVDSRTGVSAPDGVAARTADLADREVAADVLAGCDAVVHLAGNPSPRAEWPDLTHPNVQMLDSVLRAAHEAGVSRVVLASSIHAMGAYPYRGRLPVRPYWPPAPCCPYGATKALAEALGAVYTYRTDMSVIALRLGDIRPRPLTVGALTSWLSPRDLRRLVAAAIDANVEQGVYHGVSANDRHEWDTGNAQEELGYEPMDDSEEYADIVDPAIERMLCHPIRGMPSALATTAATEGGEPPQRMSLRPPARQT